ncbi:histidine kinase dimerization/phospho-acceptor domain-containing protein [Halopseudomonas pachastrellae]|nr:histidine kinase dimerization/phospho-acceptor domain-containing protein [Halopseudomonas pachastrellae]
MWRFTSHELRTPISVIRANVELLERLRAQSRIDPAMEQQALDRIDRASLTMQHLTETLLWLAVRMCSSCRSSASRWMRWCRSWLSRCVTCSTGGPSR